MAQPTLKELHAIVSKIVDVQAELLILGQMPPIPIRTYLAGQALAAIPHNTDCTVEEIACDVVRLADATLARLEEPHETD